MIRRLLSGLVCLLALCCCIAPAAARTGFPGPNGDVQAWLNLPPDMTTGAEWYILALSHTGDWDFSACRPALLQALVDTSPAAHTTRLKYALVLQAAGSSDPVIAATLAASAGQQGVMSHVYALHLMNNGVSAPGLSARDTIGTLLSLQLPDGGWALRGTASDPDVTAMVLQALAPHAADEPVAAAIARALDRLSGLQRPEGDFASYGTPNPESTAQVIIALAELGIDPATDPRFIQSGVTPLDGLARYRLEGGRYAHMLNGPANVNATTQAFLALTACDLLAAGQPGLYRLELKPATASPETHPVAHNNTPFPWRIIAAGAILLLTLVICTALLITHRPPKNCLAVLLAAGLLLLLVLTLDIQSSDSYYSGQLPDKPDAIGTVTLSIRCSAALSHPDAKGLPENGMILAPVQIPVAPGDTVFTLLTEAARAYGIHLESSGGPGMHYVQGIANLYEFSLGDLSGWLYFVNGESLSVGCDQYAPVPGDTIEWLYTLDMGGDIGR